jgi:hypothetical protein
MRMRRRGKQRALPALAACVVALVAAACVPAKPPAPASTTTTTAAPGPPVGSGTGDQNGSLGSCPVFPTDNAWNTDISTTAVHPNSTNYINQILADGGDFLHADFGSNPDYGIPYITVPGTEPKVPVVFGAYEDESDPGPYPIPLGAPVEGGGDRHVLAVDRDNCMLYEMGVAWAGSNHWDAAGGAVFDLRSNALRPDTWTSTDAAGLPIFAGLARYDEVTAGVIDHALRVTFSQTQHGFIHPATHQASSSTNPNRPPMGLRLRLKASFDITGYTGQARVVLEALKKYGLIVADNGSNWFISGATDARWDDEDLDQLKGVPGSAFEVVDTGPIQTG